MAEQRYISRQRKQKRDREKGGKPGEYYTSEVKAGAYLKKEGEGPFCCVMEPEGRTGWADE